ncbi:MAG: prepilin-type N-terminal cleavage/methylation domain-containing protein [Nitrospiraceae bacterium]|nr:prepilin-type N-terminal cleavage/methylation domain-containing protein [Nitrospiraceae bacterium]
MAGGRIIGKKTCRPAMTVRATLRDERGFTLLELIVVMVLMLLLLSLSAAMFANTLPSSAFSATVREMSTAMRLARSLAQLKGTSQVLVIDLDNRVYGIEKRGEKTLPETIRVKVIDPIAGEITTGRYRIIFPSTGGAEGGTVVLSNRNRTAQISADPVVGSVVIK